MLTIHLAGRVEDDSPFFYDGTITDLFRTVRVIGQAVVFVELSPGHLLNLSEVERIEESDDTPEYSPTPDIEGMCPPDDGAQGLR